METAHDRAEKLAELGSIKDGLPARVAVPRLAVLLQDGDSEVRHEAAAAAGGYADAYIARRLIDVVRRDPAPSVRTQAAGALAVVVRAGDLAHADAPGYVPDPEAGEPEGVLFQDARAVLLELLDAPAPELRRAAAQSLAYLSHEPRAVAAVERLAADADRASRRAALVAMGRSGDAARWREAIVTALAGGERELLAAAARAAGEVELREAEGRLAALLGDGSTDRSVRLAAAEALGRLGGGAVPALLAASETDGDDDVRAAAHAGLEELGGDGEAS